MDQVYIMIRAGGAAEIVSYENAPRPGPERSLNRGAAVDLANRVMHGF